MASSPEEQDDLESPLQSPSPPPTSPPAPNAPQSRPLSGRSSTDLPIHTGSSVFNMTSSSAPLGNLRSARGPPAASQQPMAARGGAMFSNNPDIAAKLNALKLQRSGPPPSAQGRSPTGPGTPSTDAPAGGAIGGFPAGFKLPPGLSHSNSSPAVTGVRTPGKGLSERRGMKLPGGLPGQASPPSAGGMNGRPGRPKPGMKLSDIGAGSAANGAPAAPHHEQSEMEKYSEYIDTKNGAITFKGQATVTGEGVEFASGRTYKISLDEVDRLGEPLGKGNYGTVYKVRHSRPKFRTPGQGLVGHKVWTEEEIPSSPARTSTDTKEDGTSGVVMAMKEMRLELDDAKFRSIIMELDILHKCISPYIVDFYGAFFQEGAVYICLEFMDGGSIDKVYGDGVPENVLRKITVSTTLGLKSLKEEHNIIHRDVKPTNILLNTRGQVKICDFGVSGNLVASIAKTNIGCQSYMAPERISGGGVAQAGANPGGGTYSVQSDIWSLGLTIIECAMGRYPYPPETYDNIFSQLAAIVDGEPPDLPKDQYSDAARDFVAGCLNKIPKLRPTYPMLLQHPWLAPLVKPETIAEEDEDAPDSAQPTLESRTAPDADGFVDREVGEWVIAALDRKAKGLMGNSAKPALHAAPLDTIGSPTETTKPVAVDA